MEKNKSKKRKKDIKDDEQQNEEKESSLLKLRVQKKIPIKGNENIFLINNDILIVFKKENKNKKEVNELYEIYDGETYQKISTFTNSYKSPKISNIINLFSKEPNILSLATLVEKEKEKKNISIISFEIKDKKYQYKDNQLIEIDFIPKLIELNDTSFLVLNKEKKEIYIYQKKNSNYEKRKEIIKMPSDLEIEDLKAYFINKNNFILTDLKPDQDSEEDASLFHLYIYNLNDFKFIRKESITLSDDNCFNIEKVVICNYNDMNLLLAFNNNIALYNYKDKEIKQTTELEENFQIAFGAQFKNNTLRIYGGNLSENNICLYDFKVSKDSFEFYSQSENIFDDLLLDEIDGQELGNIACDYFNKDLFSKNILVYDKDNLYVLSEKEVEKVRKSGNKKKSKSKSKNN